MDAHQVDRAAGQHDRQVAVRHGSSTRTVDIAACAGRCFVTTDARSMARRRSGWSRTASLAPLLDLRCARERDVGLLRTGRDEDCGKGLEVLDELVELGRLQDAVGRGRELVG